jgi:hypothetical protein
MCVIILFIVDNNDSVCLLTKMIKYFQFYIVLKEIP